MNEPQLNPYAAPQATELGLVNLDSPDEKERRYYLKHETSIRSFSLIYFVGGAILLIFVFVIAASTWNRPGIGPTELAILAIQTVIGVAQLVIAVAIRKLTKFGRLGGTVLAVLGLLAIPIGTLLSAYFLYLLWSEKGNVVFTPRYKQIIDRTPHIKYKTSIIVWIAFFILAALILSVVVALLIEYTFGP